MLNRRIKIIKKYVSSVAIKTKNTMFYFFTIDVTEKIKKIEKIAEKNVFFIKWLQGNAK